jgi:hypothetical protein
MDRKFTVRIAAVTLCAALGIGAVMQSLPSSQPPRNAELAPVWVGARFSETVVSAISNGNGSRT